MNYTRPYQHTELIGNFVPLMESAVRTNGTALVKLIQSGWGSSGYYPAEVLRRDGPKIFKTGLQMFWNHQTATEAAERPEGSLNNLAGQLISDARWQDSGPAGPGLYADAKVFGPYKETVKDMYPYIGVSIRASGRTQQGTAEGKAGPIVNELIAARSVDYVTVAGAGGKVVQMFEAARQKAVTSIETRSNGMDAYQQELSRCKDLNELRAVWAKQHGAAWLTTKPVAEATPATAHLGESAYDQLSEAEFSNAWKSALTDLGEAYGIDPVLLTKSTDPWRGDGDAWDDLAKTMNMPAGSAKIMREGRR